MTQLRLLAIAIVVLLVAIAVNGYVGVSNYDSVREAQTRIRDLALRNKVLTDATERLARAGVAESARIHRFLEGKGTLKNVPGKNGVRGARGVPGGIGPVGRVGERGQPGRPPTSGEIFDAVTVFCAARRDCVGAVGPVGPAGSSTPGPRGADGRDGKDGRDATDSQVAAAVANYCAARNSCVGPPGQNGAPGSSTTGATGANGAAGPPGPEPKSFQFQSPPGVTHICTDPSGTGNYVCS
jgi:hypothetical protein